MKLRKHSHEYRSFNMRHNAFNFSYGNTFFLWPFRVFLGFVWSVSMAMANGLSTDGTMGAAQTLSGVSVTVPQSLGTTAGNNLFHSFSEFNIVPGQTVRFTGSNSLQNVISRVTGPDSSSINGVLQSLIPNAAFFFINPHGVTFGVGAQVDVPGAFHVSTADKLDFQHGGGSFYTDPNLSSTLSNEAPASLGFLATNAANNGLIEVNNAHLAVNTGQKMDMVAGGITVENGASLTAVTGEIRLVAKQGGGEVSVQNGTDGGLSLPDNTPTTTNAGDVKIIAGTIDSSGNGGGRVAIWGGNTVFTNGALINADNTGVIDATIEKGIVVYANELTALYSSFTFSAYDRGSNSNANVYFAITDNFDLYSSSSIFTNAYGIGGAGNTVVNAGGVLIDGRGSDQLISGIFSASGVGGGFGTSLYSTGHAGSIRLNVINDIFIYEHGGVNAASSGLGDAGGILVNARNLYIDGRNNANFILPNNRGIGGTGISVYSSGIGNGGNVDINLSGALNMYGGGVITSQTSGVGSAGNLAINAHDINVNGNGYSFNFNGINLITGIYSDTVFGGRGDAGILDIHVLGNLAVNGGRISSSSAFSSGNAGDVKINAGNIKIDSLGLVDYEGILSASFYSSGHAGEVNVISNGFLDIMNGGSISSSVVHSFGNAGDVNVQAKNITIDGANIAGQSTGILSLADNMSTGNAGSVTVKALVDLKLLNEGSISSSSLGMGHAGNVNIDASQLDLVTGDISAAVGPVSDAQSGNINIQVGGIMRLIDQSLINIENAGTAVTPDFIRPGNIAIHATDIIMQNSRITSNSIGNVSAGNIIINFSHSMYMDPSFISTTANTGNGGSISIDGKGLLMLQNSSLTTDVSGANGNGGNILISVPELLLETGAIQANAIGGYGGNIILNLNSLISSNNTLIEGGDALSWLPNIIGFNLIQAASQTGVSGSLNVTVPQLDLSGVFAHLNGLQFDRTVIGQNYCGFVSGSTLTSVGNGGLVPKGNDLVPY